MCSFKNLKIPRLVGSRFALLLDCESGSGRNSKQKWIYMTSSLVTIRSRMLKCQLDGLYPSNIEDSLTYNTCSNHGVIGQFSLLCFMECQRSSVLGPMVVRFRSHKADILFEFKKRYKIAFSIVSRDSVGITVPSCKFGTERCSHPHSNQWGWARPGNVIFDKCIAYLPL